MIRWLLLLVVLLTVDCHAVDFIYTANTPVSAERYPEITVWVDKSFGEVDRLAIDDSINTWNYVLNGSRKFRVVSWKFNMDISDIDEAQATGGLLILKISKLDPRVWPGDLAWVDQIGGRKMFVVRESMPKESDLKLVMLHELGHVLGARHKDGDNLMNPTFDSHKYQCVDAQTVEQVAKAQWIPFEQLNYCFSHK